MKWLKRNGLAVLFVAAVVGAGSCCGVSEAEEQSDIIITYEDDQNDPEFSFADVANVEFWFSSGVGAWGTGLRIYEDGSFEGQYHDSDMGDTGDGYPGGTVYLSEFTGRFTEPVKVNDYTFSFLLDSIELAQEIDTEEIRNEVRYVYSVPYGMDGGEEFLIYLPGAPLQELPEAFRGWVGYYDLSATTDTELAFYGLYNVQGEYGFSGYAVAEEESPDDELAAIEAEAEALNRKMETEDLTQAELNETAASLYQLWDDELNDIWSELKTTLDEEAMDQLVQDELEWIAYKESEMQAAGAQYQDGSIREMVQYKKGAELTKERTYELAEMLN